MLDLAKVLHGHGANLFAIEVDGVNLEVEDAITLDAKGNRIVLKDPDSGENDDIDIVANGTEITCAVGLKHILSWSDLATLLDWHYVASPESISPANPDNGAPAEFTLKIKASTNRKQETTVTDEDLTYTPTPDSNILVFTGTLAETPIKPGTVTITTGSEACTDSATPNVLAGTNVNGTINYLSGNFTLTFGAGHAPAVGDARHGTYTYYTTKQFQGLAARAVLDGPAPSGALNFKRGEKTILPVQFRILRDTSSTAVPFIKFTLVAV